MIKNSKMNKLLIPLCLLFVLFMYMYSQEGIHGRVSYKQKSYALYPETMDTLPGLPSPFTTEDGREIVIGITKDKTYTLLPVTVENGKPYVYGKYEKGKQLEVDGKDFPTLARTGLHSELELDLTKQITGRSISEITCSGRPNGLSGAGFMSEDEDIISVLKGDNRLVQRMGLTHQQIAKSFFHLWNSILKMIEEYRKNNRPYGYVAGILYNGRAIAFEVGATKGWQDSIFADEILGGYHINIRVELEEKEKHFLNKRYAHLGPGKMAELIKKLSHIHTGEMEPYYIKRYGFYEGHTDYRTDPVTLAFMFGLRSLTEIEKAFEGNLYKVLTQHFTRESIPGGE